MLALLHPCRAIRQAGYQTSWHCACAGLNPEPRTLISEPSTNVSGQTKWSWNWRVHACVRARANPTRGDVRGECSKVSAYAPLVCAARFNAGDSHRGGDNEAFVVRICVHTCCHFCVHAHLHRGGGNEHTDGRQSTLFSLSGTFRMTSRIQSARAWSP